MKHREFRVAVTVAYTVELNVHAHHSRDAAHVAVDQLRKAYLHVDSVPQDIVSMEVLSTKIITQK